jgi:hypothetical protein
MPSCQYASMNAHHTDGKHIVDDAVGRRFELVWRVPVRSSLSSDAIARNLYIVFFGSFHNGSFSSPPLPFPLPAPALQPRPIRSLAAFFSLSSRQVSRSPELAPKTGFLLGNQTSKTISKRPGSNTTQEAPFIMKLGDYFYLFVSLLFLPLASLLLPSGSRLIANVHSTFR